MLGAIHVRVEGTSKMGPVDGVDSPPTTNPSWVGMVWVAGGPAIGLGIRKVNGWLLKFFSQRGLVAKGMSFLLP